MGQRTKRERNILLRVSDGEHGLIAENAGKAGLTISEFLRQLGMSGTVVVAELSKGDSAIGDSQAKAERVGGSTSPEVSLAERRARWDREFKALKVRMPGTSAKRLLGSRP
jgi:Mobilization protein NikA